MARPRSISVSSLAWGTVALCLIGVVIAYVTGAIREPVGHTPAEGFEALRAAADYETSTNCAACHYQRTRTWKRTFHRTMTQRAQPGAVTGAFDGRPRSLAGVRTVPFQRDGRYYIETAHTLTGEPHVYEVVRAVGSRRMQQYVTRIGDRHVRLPVAWSMVEDRWFHLSEAFFHRDGESFHANTTVWDVNCIFCHNVRPQPGWDLNGQAPPVVAEFGMELFAGGIDSEVAELGIACEACHGPGGEHARRMRSPARRYAYHWGADGDPTIVDPADLDRERSVMVCARCHGQRIPAESSRIREIMLTGDPFTPGEDLSRYYQPVTHQTTLGDFEYALRFWKDGSPRLTAYEYQGLLRTRCYTHGEMTCLSCHAMHSGDPRGQIRPDRAGDAMCLQCHGEYAGDGLERHTHHKPDSSGSRCVACHMPDVVYGVMSWHPTHEIKSPDPAHAAANGKPDACTLCHSGQSLRWAIEKSAAWWPQSTTMPASLNARYALAEIPRALLAGDVVYRALAAHRLGQPSPDEGVDAVAPALLATTLLDVFPNVRRNARNALLLRGGVDVPQVYDERSTRAAYRDRLTAVPLGETLPPALNALFQQGRLDSDWVRELVDGREEVPFSFGE